MYSEVINYTDFDGNKGSERVYFNISKSDIAKMNLKYEGGLYEFLKRIIASRDQLQINKYFEELVDLSYGVKLDNKHFDKSPEALKKFKSSVAYDEWFFKLCTDADYATKFVNSVLPDDISSTEISEADKDKIAKDFVIDKSVL